jgi:hypothetical protein
MRLVEKSWDYIEDDNISVADDSDFIVIDFVF